MNLNPTPKQVFLSVGTNISNHRRLLESPDFLRAIDVAQRHYVRALTGIAPTDLTQANHVVASGMCFQRIQGMHDFVDILMRLSEVPPPMKPRQVDNLEGN